MKHKVGDVVKVREDLRAGKDFGNLCVCYPMVKFAGKLVTISSVNGDDYFIEEDDGEYYWIDDFFEDDEENREDDNCCVDKILEEEKKSDEYEDIIDNVLDNMSKKTKDNLIKKLIEEVAKEGKKVTIVAVPVYEIVCRHDGIAVQQIVDSKYSVTVTTKDGTVVL